MSPTLQTISGAGAAGLTAAAITFGLTPVVRAVAIRFGWVAKPVEDRWGRRMTARLGGVAIFAGIVGATVAWVPIDRTLAGWLIGLSLVFLLGLVDDIRRLPPYAKLVAQLLIGCVMVISGIRIELIEWTWLAIPLSVLWFVLIMNAFNLLDNMDGLAAGVGALAAGFCAVHAAMSGQVRIVSLSLVLCGSCLGFLRFNFPPAKIYMGDSGSHLLGLTLATLALLGSWHGSTQLLSVLAVPVLVLAVPIFDTLFVTIQRLVHGHHPFEGGRDHVSHRLAVLGLSPRQTAVALYAISAALGAVSVVSVTLRPVQALVIWLVTLTMLILLGGYLSRVNVYRIEPQPAGPPAEGSAVPATFIETMLLHKRRLVEILADFCLLSSAYVVAHLLRFDGVLTGDLQSLILRSLPVVLIVKVVCFAGCGIYRGMWRYLGLADILQVFRAVTLGSVMSSLVLLFLWRFEGYSRAVLIIDWMLSFLAVAGSRVVERLLDDWISSVSTRHTPVVIIGAGDTGERVLRHLRDLRSDRRPVGFLDDDPRKLGARLHGVSVLGGRKRLAAILERYGVREVLIAINDPPGDLLQAVQECCEPRGVTWMVVATGLTASA